MTVLRTFTLGTLAAMSFAITAQAADDTMISDVDVTVELGDVEDANALEFWPTIEEDMEKIMTLRASSRIAPGGVDIDVSVTDVSLSGSKMLDDAGEFNTLQAWVYVRDKNGGNLIKNFKVNLRAETGRPGLQDGMVVLPDMQDFYNALLNGFADATLKRIDEL